LKNRVLSLDRVETIIINLLSMNQTEKNQQIPKKISIFKSYLKRINSSSIKFFLVQNKLIIVLKDLFKLLILPKKFNSNNLFYLKYNKLFQPVVYEKNISDKELLNIYKNNWKQIESAHEIYNDQKSKDILLSLIKARITKKISWIPGLVDSNQYFDEILNPMENSIQCFFDIGSYDGSTSIKAIDKFFNLKSLYLFDPNPLSIKNSKNKILKSTKNINVQFFEYGLSDVKGNSKFFDYGSGSSINPGHYSKISENIYDIQLEKLDDFDVKFNKEVYLKYDIEGNELKALVGSKKTIEKFRPIIAICVYHRIEDLWVIPNWIYSLNLNYNLYLRHYSQNTLNETVLYCIPH